MQVLHKPTAIERQRMAGHVAIVTGAAHGLGAAIARRLLAEGAEVVALDINPEGLQGFSGEPRAAVLAGDITRPETAEKAVVLAVEKFGKVDVLVNNAGIMDAFKPVTEVTDELWAKVLAVNVTAPMMLTRAVLPRMLEQGGGAIVNVSSIGGIVGGRAGAAYTASKHALIGLTRNTAANYIKDGVRCNAVCPGAVVGGVLGGFLLLQTGEKLFKELVPFLILLASVLLAIQDPVRAWMTRRIAEGGRGGGLENASWLPVGLASIYGGYFGAGLSVIVLSALGLTLEDNLTRLNALKQAVAFAVNVAAAIFFLFSGKVVWAAALVMAVGALIGGVLGGRLAGRIKPSTLRWTVIAIGVIVAVIYFLRG